MKCALCRRKPKKMYESYFSLSWEYVNKEEYNKRKKDGRTQYINTVCPDCIEKYKGRPPLGLKDLNEIRKRGITNNDYYKEHGY